MRNRLILLLLFPLGMGIWALRTHELVFKMGEPLACALVLLVHGLWFGFGASGFIIMAFLWSSLGDYFLSNRNGYEPYFIFGIGAFFVAHLGYLTFALKPGRVGRTGLGILLAVYLPFFTFYLRPAIRDPALLWACLLYLLVSCVSLAAALGWRAAGWAKILFVAGIGWIVLSDTIIALSEFLHYRHANWLILPTYYLSHLCITSAVMIKKERPAQIDRGIARGETSR